MTWSVPQQLETLERYPDAFSERSEIRGNLGPDSLTVFQINLGKKCNQACTHCHVEAGPLRTEMMGRKTVEKCLEIIRGLPQLQTVDITGGAPEMHPDFRHIVTESRKAGKHVIDRCNLTILEEPGYESLADFLRDQEVEVVASLPHFARSRTDQQRGKGVFDKSVTALKKLNALGYGEDLPLNLVYNPQGMLLSGSQEQLEREFKEKLQSEFGIRFNHLYCINNVPINRFLEALLRRQKFSEYMNLLSQAYNPATVAGLMCRNQISVSYTGHVYDCDFNQMLEIPAETVTHINEFSRDKFMARKVAVGNHCYACTAGSGSSCGGAITE